MMTFKTALVLEGGGMRGPFTAGVLSKFLDQGRKFDLVVGASAGSVLGGYFAAGQKEELKALWTEHLPGKRFINYGALPLFNGTRHWGNVMDLDYLFEEILDRKGRMDVDAIRGGSTKLIMTATNRETAQAHYFDANDPAIPLLDAIKASAGLPIAYQTPIVVEGTQYLDGGIADPVPVMQAIDRDVGSIVVILTRPAGFRKSNSPASELLMRAALTTFGFPYDSPINRALAHQGQTYNEAYQRIEELEGKGRIRVIRPEAPLPSGRLTRDREPLVRTFELGQKAAQSYLEQHPRPAR